MTLGALEGEGGSVCVRGGDRDRGRAHGAKCHPPLLSMTLGALEGEGGSVSVCVCVICACM